MSRITVFTGPFGSGKSEIAVNWALKLRADGRPVVLADLDLVNSFFRSSDAAGTLRAAGVRLIGPVYANTNVDVPALPRDIQSVFDDPASDAVLDAGGDEVGARSLARFHADIERAGYTMHFVVNPYRPFAGTPAQIREAMAAIEASARLKVTALVCNANLLEHTGPGTVLEGLETVRAASRETGIPIAFTAGFPDVLDRLPPGSAGELFRMTRTMRAV